MSPTADHERRVRPQSHEVPPTKRQHTNHYKERAGRKVIDKIPPQNTFRKCLGELAQDGKQQFNSEQDNSRSQR